MLREYLADLDLNKEMENAKVIVESTFEQLGLKELVTLTTIEFNSKFTCTAGDARLLKKYTTYSGRIRLGSKYFGVASEKDKMETVIHEACHIANKYLYFVDSDWRQFHYNPIAEKKTKGHGPSWVTLMQRMQIPANRFHCTNVTQFKSYYLYTCPQCTYEWKLTSNIGTRIKNGTRGAMCKCKKYFNPNLFRKVSGADLTYGTV